MILKYLTFEQSTISLECCQIQTWKFDEPHDVAEELE